MNRPPQCLEFTDSTTSQFAIVLRPHTPLLLFASLAACQPPRASGFEVRAGCPRARLLLPGLGFTHPECQEGCPVSQCTFQQAKSSSKVSSTPAAEGDCLCVGHKWLPPAAWPCFAVSVCGGGRARVACCLGEDTSSARAAVSLKGLWAGLRGADQAS